MTDWGLEECKRVGCSLACFLRNRKNGQAAVDAWRLHYVQLNDLFTKIPGFENFMVDLASNTLKDSIYGTVYRVSVGAFFSTLDAATDIFTVRSYYANGLGGRANALLIMISLNALLQTLSSILVQYKKKNWDVKVKEAMINIFFLRPAVDAYRVSTNHEDNDLLTDPLTEVRCCSLGGGRDPKRGDSMI